MCGMWCGGFMFVIIQGRHSCMQGLNVSVRCEEAVLEVSENVLSHPAQTNLLFSLDFCVFSWRQFSSYIMHASESAIPTCWLNLEKPPKCGEMSLRNHKEDQLPCSKLTWRAALNHNPGLSRYWRGLKLPKWFQCGCSVLSAGLLWVDAWVGCWYCTLGKVVW